MREARATLVACRACRKRVEELSASVARLEKGARLYNDSVLAAAREREAAQLQQARKELPVRVASAMALLDRISGRDQSVLYHYFVLGWSLDDVRREVGYAGIRSVQRAKARGLARLKGLQP